MSLDIGGAAGGAIGLREVIEQKLKEQQVLAQRQQFAQKLAEDQRQANMVDAVQHGNLDLGTRRVNEDVRQFDAQAPLRLANVGHLGAETESLNRAPVEAQKQRDFSGGQSEAQRTFTGQQGDLNRGNAVRIAGINGVNALRVANARAEATGEPVVRVQTVDENGNPITRILPRSVAAGQDFKAPPTSQQRDRTANAGRANPVIDSIAELSERINTGQGAMAKITGAAERAKAEANLNDDVAEYQAVVSGFTPLLARAMGHTGVLTEQDVQSVRKMLPDVGDSKSVRDRKISRIEHLLGAQGSSGGQKAGGADPLGIR
jgi:hypothetical protein